MTKIEQYIYDWIKKNLGLLCVIAVTAIRLWICFYLRRFVRRLSSRFAAMV